MKKIILIPILTILVSITSAFAQSKVGYVEYDLLISLMPEVATIQNQLKSKTAEYEGVIGAKQQEMAQIEQFVQSNPTMDEVIREGKIRQYQALQQEIQEFSYTAQQKLEAMELQLVQPVYVKLDKSIGEVATEKGYDYVLSKNNAGGFMVIFAKNAEDNLTQAVKDKLGLKDAPVTGAASPATNSLMVK